MPRFQPFPKVKALSFVQKMELADLHTFMANLDHGPASKCSPIKKLVNYSDSLSNKTCVTNDPLELTAN